ncbi:MAG: aspartate kinase [Gammaproteobacteria bacterium]|nr:aspartate kinase [Gammaproteobacteria bacterium]
MALIVQKFGGTSVGSIERIQSVAARVARWQAQGHQLVVVVSAMAGETNRLIGLAEALGSHPDRRELDVVMATGEQVTIGLVAIALQTQGLKARSYMGGQVAIRTDARHGKARIDQIDAEGLLADLEQGIIPVVAGFQGVSPSGDITTLGRGGSDTTAVALAAALKADECQIYTDVDGVYTTDPRIVPEARRLDRISFEEMLELASVGAKVLQTRSVEFAGKYNVPLRVLSSFDDGPGTLITYEDAVMEAPKVSGIAYNRDEAKLTVLRIPDRPGVGAEILAPLGNAGIEVDMIVQNASRDGYTDFTFTVHRNDFPAAKTLVEPIAAKLGAEGVLCDNKVVKVSIVGVGMRSHAGVASKMFQILGAEGINMQAISTSEIKVSVLLEEKYLELAVRALHAAFGLEQAAD